MNWFRDFFSLKHTQLNSADKAVTETFSTQQLLQWRECADCTPPIAENTEPLNYGQLQHLVPLRQLDIQAISDFCRLNAVTFAD